MTKLKGFKKSQKPKARPGQEKKKKSVAALAKMISEAKTVVLLDVRGLPDRLLQSARKQLRGKAKFVMAKNSVLIRALDEAKNAKELAAHINSPSVIVLSDSLSPYQIFKHFKDNKKPVAAKPGQVAPFDIVVPVGETDLPPGPALSELKNAGINAQIKAGKIIIAKDSTVAKTGAKISDAVCKALQKLNILPFTAKVNMVAGVEGKYLYRAEVLDIDELQLAQDLAGGALLAYNMSLNCSYPTEANRNALLAGALAQSRALVSETGTYSTAHMELLLAQSLRMESSLEGKVGQGISSA